MNSLREELEKRVGEKISHRVQIPSLVTPSLRLFNPRASSTFCSKSFKVAQKEAIEVPKNFGEEDGRDKERKPNISDGGGGKSVFLVLNIRSLPPLHLSLTLFSPGGEEGRVRRVMLQSVVFLSDEKIGLFQISTAFSILSLFFPIPTHLISLKKQRGRETNKKKREAQVK